MNHGGRGAAAPQKQKERERGTWTYTVDSRGARCCSATSSWRASALRSTCDSAMAFRSRASGLAGSISLAFCNTCVVRCVVLCYSVFQCAAVCSTRARQRVVWVHSLSLFLSLSLARALSVSLSFSLDCLGLFELWCCTIPHSTFDTGAPVSKRPRQSSTCVSRYCATLELLV